MAEVKESPLKKVCIICAKGTIEDVYATLVIEMLVFMGQAPAR